jgi:hypothetical protein
MSAMSNHTNERMNAECADFGADFENAYDDLTTLPDGVKIKISNELYRLVRAIGDHHSACGFSKWSPRDVLAVAITELYERRMI